MLHSVAGAIVTKMTQMAAHKKTAQKSSHNARWARHDMVCPLCETSQRGSKVVSSGQACNGLPDT